MYLKSLVVQAELLPAIERNLTLGLAPASTPHVFLTGVSGFLGAFILQDLLRPLTYITDKEHDTRLVYCLVRKKTKGGSSSAQEGGEDDNERFFTWLLGHLTSLRIAIPLEVLRRRVRPVFGELSMPRFGVSAEVWKELEQLGIIIHSAAQVSAVLPYSVVREPNVNGTMEVS